MTPDELKTRRERRAIEARIAGQRLRRRRIEAGLTQKRAAQNAGVTFAMWRIWEVGSRPYSILDLPSLAAALAIPIASLLTDDLVLAEVRVSNETLERTKREGRPAAREVAERLAGNLEALLLAEASRPPVDLSPAARAKPRRSREQLLALRTKGIAAAEQHAAQRRAAHRRHDLAQLSQIR